MKKHSQKVPKTESKHRDRIHGIFIVVVVFAIAALIGVFLAAVFQEQVYQLLIGVGGQ